MKQIPIIVVSAAILIFGGCATDRGSSRSAAGSQTNATRPSSVGPLSEVVTYEWDSAGVDVTFAKDVKDSCWQIEVVDWWSIYEHPADEVWGPSASKCSKEQCLELIDNALTQFQTEKPDARFSSVSIEMQLVRELWSEILAALKQKLPTLSGKVTFEPCYSPDAVDETLQRVLDKSATVSEVLALLKKHGLAAQHPFIGSTLCFKMSLGGRRWSELSNLPDSGVGLPGIVEFDFDASSAGQAVNGSSLKLDARRAFPENAPQTNGNWQYVGPPISAIEIMTKSSDIAAARYGHSSNSTKAGAQSTDDSGTPAAGD